MTDTVSRIEELMAELAAALEVERDRAVGPEPLAGALPPYVAAGELITSAWGNAVVDEQARQRLEGWSVFDHAGVSGVGVGAYDLGTTTIPVDTTHLRRITVSGVVSFGFAGGDVVAVTALNRYVDATALNMSPAWAHATTWTHVPVAWSWDVPANASANFKTVVDLQAITAGSAYAKASGIYHVQVRGTP